MTDADARPETARLLDLAPHPEGGWFRRTWTAPASVSTPGGERPTATAIHYLLAPGESAAWHVVASDELWLWHGPGAVELLLGGKGEAPSAEAAWSVVRLGGDVARADTAQFLVEAGTWQAARLCSGAEALLTCVVSPGFDFADWRLASEPL